MRNQYGFTIVELTVVVSLIVLLSIASVPPMSNYYSNYKTRKVACQLFETLQEAKLLAIKERNNVMVQFGTEDGDSRFYDVLMLREDGRELLSRITIDQHVKALRDDSVRHVSFNSRGFSTLGGDSCELIVQNHRTNLAYRVEINPIGNIRIGKFTTESG